MSAFAIAPQAAGTSLQHTGGASPKGTPRPLCDVPAYAFLFQKSPAASTPHAPSLRFPAFTLGRPSDNFPYFRRLPCRFSGRRCIDLPRFPENPPKNSPDFFHLSATILSIQSKILVKFLVFSPLTASLTSSHKKSDNFVYNKLYTLSTWFSTVVFPFASSPLGTTSPFCPQAATEERALLIFRFLLT